MKKAMVLGVLSSLFFALTFICNRSMSLSGGYWLWTACLRYLLSLPLLLIIVASTKGLRGLFIEIKKHPFLWVIWSFIGFGIFYLSLTAASLFGESWFTCASWQIVIVTGILLTPLFGKKIPVRNLFFAVLILSGIIALQASHINTMKVGGIGICSTLMLIAAITYPLGNRKMMQICSSEITTVQRVCGMTICSLPLWLVCAGIAFVRVGLPSSGQLIQSSIVAVFSAVVATVLYFEATNIVHNNPRQLAVVEATVSFEILFVLIGGILFLKDPIPDVLGFIGIFVVIAGMVGNSLSSSGVTTQKS